MPRHSPRPSPRPGGPTSKDPATGQDEDTRAMMPLPSTPTPSPSKAPAKIQTQTPTSTSKSKRTNLNQTIVSPTPSSASKSRGKQKQKEKGSGLEVGYGEERDEEEDGEGWVQSRLRRILVGHRSKRKEWNEIVLGEGLRTVKKVVELRNESISANDLSSSITNTKLRRALKELSTVLDEISTASETLRSLVTSTEELLYEACRKRSNEYAFTEPLWTTWPLVRFFESLDSLTSQYTQSTTLLQTLLQTLSSQPPPPRSGNSDAKETVEVFRKENQAILSIWAVRPLFRSGRCEGLRVRGWGGGGGGGGGAGGEGEDWDDDSGGGEGGEEWFEDVCEVEIRGWKR